MHPCTGRMAHRGSRGIALFFLDHGTRRGWGVSVTPRPLFTPGKDPVPIVQEAGWAPGPVWTGAQENLAPTGIRSPNRLARSQSLYRLSYPAHNFQDRVYFFLPESKLQTNIYWQTCVHYLAPNICLWVWKTFRVVSLNPFADSVREFSVFLFDLKKLLMSVTKSASWCTVPEETRSSLRVVPGCLASISSPSHSPATSNSDVTVCSTTCISVSCPVRTIQINKLQNVSVCLIIRNVL